MRTKRLALARLPWQALLAQHWPTLAGALVGVVLTTALSQALTFYAHPRSDAPVLKLKWSASGEPARDSKGANAPPVVSPTETTPEKPAQNTPEKAPEQEPKLPKAQTEPAAAKAPERTVEAASPALVAVPAPPGPALQGALATTPLRQKQWAGERPQLSPMPGARPIEVSPGGNSGALPNLPRSSGEAPPVPGADILPGTFKLLGVEKPGGDVLVLGVLVNDQGQTEQVVIVVPSKYTLGDIGLMLGHQRKHWPDLIPPLLPGEKRWLELRFDHKGIDPNATDVLP